MDLTREEARELFPSDRGQSVDDVDVDPWIHIERDEFGWTITVDGEERFVPREKEEEVLEWFEDTSVDGRTMWCLLQSKTACRLALSEVTDRNT